MTDKLDMFAAGLKIAVEEHDELKKKLKETELLLATVITNLRLVKENAQVNTILHYFDEVIEGRKTVRNTLRT